jgi:hypothetical protein
MGKTCNVSVEELAAFMNVGWPGEDWYLADHAEYLWETTFTTGEGRELYRARQPGQVINLYEYDGWLRWQGYGPDPTGGGGHQLSELFLKWRRQSHTRVVVACVPREKYEELTTLLEDAGCELMAK